MTLTADSSRLPSPPRRARRFTFVQRSVLPGFGLTLGLTVTYLSLVVLLPLSALLAKAGSATWQQWHDTITSPRTLAALGLSFGASLAAAAINAVAGLMISWTLVRYSFPGKRLVDAVVDLPFAMPTAVSGLVLTALFVPSGWYGRYLPANFQVAYTRWGVLLALTFISLPFVVRTLQPAMQELDAEVEEAAASLGASRWQTFRRVVFPTLFPSLITGFALAFARAVGEYGSVVFIAANKPMDTEIAPLLIMDRLGEFNYVGATVIATLMLAVSFVMLLAINGLQWWAARRLRGGH